MRTTWIVARQKVEDFFEKMPNSSVRMKIEANDDTIEWMVSQNFDFGISTSEPSNPSFDYILIQDQDVFGVLPSSHRLAQKQKLTPKDFSSENFVSYMPSSRFKYEIDSIFERKGVSRNLRLKARTPDLICRLITRKLGVDIVGASRAHLETIPRCVAIPFEVPFKISRCFDLETKTNAISGWSDLPRCGTKQCQE